MSEDQNKLQRLLRLLLLLSGSRRYTAKELTERFETSERSIFRYLSMFKAAGLILTRNDKGYTLQTNTPAYKSLQNLLHFSEDEACILYQTLSLLEGSSPAKDRLVRKLNVLYDFAVLEQKPPNQLEIVHTIGKAIEKKHQIVLTAYRSSNSDTETDRTVEPFAFLPDYAAVWCYDMSDGNIKQFRISRMKGVAIQPQHWRYEAAHQIPYFDAFRMSAIAPLATVKASLSLKAYNLLVEEYPLADPFIEKKQKNYLLTIPVADFNGIGRFVLGLPGEVNVLEPATFKTFLKNKIKKMSG